MNWHQLVLAAAVFVVAADAPKDDATKKDLENLQGTWKVQSATRAGKEAPADEISKDKLTFDGNRITVFNGNREEKATFQLDASKKPPTIDITPDNNATKALGIYHLEGETLKLCFTKPGSERPKEFASKEGSEVALVVLKREKK
jgi:uncharacterized protein (TIGR03067 family)